MSSAALWWLLLNIFTIVALAFFSMMEMACVSFNKVRLHYYAHKGNRSAQQLSYLLQHPFRLFGTTLIGVNVATVVGSECAREFHYAIGVNPDLAPLTQVILVVIFGELAPMFAARHYAEHVAMLGVSIIYGTARLLTPLLWFIGWISSAANFFIKSKSTHADLFLTQEELEKILEEQGEPSNTAEEFNVITRNIFKLRHKSAKDIVTPLDTIPKLSSNATKVQMINLIKRTGANFILIYYKTPENIVGIAFPRDLVRINETKRIRDFARAPWFVTENTPLPEILHQFRRNNQSVAIILNQKGLAIGLLTLDDLLLEIFGEASYPAMHGKQLFFLERTFSGETLVGDFNQEFDVLLDSEQNQTLSELMINKLGHCPEEGETLLLEPFELTAKETTLLEVKSVFVKTRS